MCMYRVGIQFFAQEWRDKLREKNWGCACLRGFSWAWSRHTRPENYMLWASMLLFLMYHKNACHKHSLYTSRGLQICIVDMVWVRVKKGIFLNAYSSLGMKIRIYRAEIISDVKGSGWFVWKLALPPFSPPLPSVVQISKHNTHWTFDIRNNFTPVRIFRAT